MIRILRYEVPVDDEWHTVAIAGEVVHVASRRPDVVEFWAEHRGDFWAADRKFRVYGTGQSHVEGRHVGTALVDGQPLVWHLREMH